MSSLLLKATPCVKGQVSVPSSKSISNRALLLCALAHNYTLLSNVLVSDDTLWMLKALVDLGIEIYDLGSMKGNFTSTVTYSNNGMTNDSNRVELEKAYLQAKTELELQQILAKYKCKLVSSHELKILQKHLAQNLIDPQNLESEFPSALTLLIKGNQGLFTFNGSLDLFLGNAGTAVRPLLASLSLNQGDAQIRISGEPRMHQRPLLDLVKGLEQLGACVVYEQEYGYAPLTIYTGRKKLAKSHIINTNCCQNAYNKQYAETELKHGSMFPSITKVEIDCSVSSQYLTALLLVAPLLPLGLEIRVKDQLISKPYITLTIEMMKAFGVEVVTTDYKTFKVLPQKYYSSNVEYLEDTINVVTDDSTLNLALKQNQTQNHIKSQVRLFSPNLLNSLDDKPAQALPLVGSYRIESDASSASYFFIAGALAGQVTVNHIHANVKQGDIKLLSILEKLGAKVIYDNDSITVISNKELQSKTGYVVKNFDIDCNDIPDAAMGLAILGLFTPPGQNNILRNIASWKVKETDRILAMATELTKLGAQVTWTDDTLAVKAPYSLVSASIDTYNDHRMAMCFALVSLNQQNINITINHPNCVNKTFPKFFDVFKHLTKT